MNIKKYSWLAALPMIFTACQDDTLVENQQQDMIYTLSAKVEGSKSMSRAQIQLNNPNSGEELFFWNSEDAFNLYQKNGDNFKQSVFTIANDYQEPAEGGQPSAQFSTTTPVYAAMNYVAAYPSTVNNDWGNLRFDLNNTLDFTGNSAAEVWKSYFQNNMFMLATGNLSDADAATVSFRHLCSLVRISYTNATDNEITINRAFLSGNNQEFGTSYYYSMESNEEMVTGSTSFIELGTNGLTVAVNETVDLYLLFFPMNFGEDSSIGIGIDTGESRNSVQLACADIAAANNNAAGFEAGKRYWFKVTKTGNGMVWTKNYTQEEEEENVTFTNKELSKALYDYLEVQGNMPGVVTFDADSCAVMTPENVAAVTNLSFRNINIPALDGIENFKNLTYLSCVRTGLTSCDLSQNTALSTLNVQFNSLAALDLSKNTSLKFLYCSNNPDLASLDISNCTELQTLRLSSTALTTVSIPNPEKVGTLEYAYTSLSFELGKFTSLYSIDCSGIGPDALNAIPDELKTQLIDLICADNELTVLDLSAYPSLRNLNCDVNNLTALDLSTCIKLEHLNCYGNQLTSLDLSNCTELRNLICSDNQLTTINLTGLVNLEDLDIINNKLTSLNVSDCTILKGIHCFENQLSTLDLSACTMLESMQAGCQTDAEGINKTIQVKLADEVTSMWEERWVYDDFNKYVEIVTELDESGDTGEGNEETETTTTVTGGATGGNFYNQGVY